METKPKTVDDASWGEVGELLHDCVVQPLTTELGDRLTKTSEVEKEQLNTIEESLKNVYNSTAQLGIQAKKIDTERGKKQEADKAEVLAALQYNVSSGVEELQDEIKNVVEVDIRTSYKKLNGLLESGQKKEEESLKQLMERHDRADEALQKAQDALQENRKMLQKAQETLDEKIAGQGQNICDELRKAFSDTDHNLDKNEQELLQKLDLILSQMQESTENGNTKLTEYWENSQTALETYKKESEDASTEKYKKLLGISLSFGIVNFLGIVALLVMNFMH